MTEHKLTDQDFRDDIAQVLADQHNNVRDPDHHIDAYDMQDWARAVHEEVVAPAVDTLAWLHAEAVWHHGQTLLDYQRNDERMLAENQRLADENELLREELAKVSGGWEARVASRAALREERDALRADMGIRQGALNDVLGRDRSQDSPTDYYGAVEDVAELKRALALAEERIAKTRQALRLDEKWSVQHGALAVRSERDRAVSELSALRAQLAAAVVLPTDWYDQLAAAESGHRAAAVIAQWRAASGVDLPEAEAAAPAMLAPSDWPRSNLAATCAMDDESRAERAAALAELQANSKLEQNLDVASPAAASADTTPRVWAAGSPEPDDSVTKVIAENDVTFTRTAWGRWLAQPPEGNSRDYSWAELTALMTLTEVLPNTEQEAEK